ncbi:Nuclear fusion protein, KAR5 [Phaffia rhodozyma]|uniref:Nuclear fusion protein, KAR5 n=1 Tax=Phaffia rhodozyma TaxID=264483 RepID=A0A0F7SNS5_PHARH|nr:Nuclear fusion protein, KAR5 [Phaffia rhodozyma]
MFSHPSWCLSLSLIWIMAVCPNVTKAVWSWNNPSAVVVPVASTIDRYSRDRQIGHLSSLQDLLKKDYAQTVLSEKDNTALFSSLHLLEPSENKPDCFRAVAADFRADCATSSGSQIDGDARARVAISLTLCDLNSARLSPPMECTPFKSSADGCVKEDRECARQNKDEMNISQARCIEALARSAQMWTSYSGYLREATQLCFALQRINSVDIARSVYQNITLEKAALLRVLQQEARERDIRMNEFDSNVRQWKDGLKDFETSRQALSDIHLSMANFFSPSELARTSQESIDSLVRSIKTQMEAEMEGVSDVMLQKTRETFDKNFESHEEVVSRVVQTVYSSLERTAEQHEVVLQRLTDSLAVSSEQLATKLVNLEGTVERTHSGMERVQSNLQSVYTGLEISLNIALQTQTISSSVLFDLAQTSSLIENLTSELERQAALINSTNQLLSTQSNGAWGMIFGSRLVMDLIMKGYRLCFGHQMSIQKDSWLLSILALPFASSTPLIFNTFKKVWTLSYHAIVWILSKIFRWTWPCRRRIEARDPQKLISLNALPHTTVKQTSSYPFPPPRYQPFPTPPYEILRGSPQRFVKLGDAHHNRQDRSICKMSDGLALSRMEFRSEDLTSRRTSEVSCSRNTRAMSAPLI